MGIITTAEKTSYDATVAKTTNINNTSDLNKPISKATQTALDAKPDQDTIYDDKDVVKAPSGVLPVLDGSNLTNLPSGGGGASIPNTNISGNWQWFYKGSIYSNASGSGTGVLKFRPIIIGSSFTADAFGIRVLSTIALNIKMALYSSDPTTPTDLTLVKEADNLLTTTTQADYVVPVVGNVDLDSSLLYWLAFETDDAGLKGPLTSGEDLVQIIGADQIAKLYSSYGCLQVSHTFGSALPTNQDLSSATEDLYCALVALRIA